ncbi:MAG: TIGR01777 family oxidoreductase [Candidatus Sericytochromatia bacterium]
MNIIISGGSGLIGQALVKSLKQDGHNIKTITRNKNTSENQIFWDIERNIIESDKLENSDVIIHLAGENISGDNPIQGRWTNERKEKILNSRVKGTKLLANTILNLKKQPKLFISASAIGYYGDRGSEVLDEKSFKGKGFLSDVCQKWEEETNVLKNSNIRLVNTRFGVVLSKDGGALKAMLFPFQMGVGGIIGNGKQFMSWVDIDDVVGSIKHIINNSEINGIVNIVSPSPITNYEYTKTLGSTLNRPTIFPIPKIGINLLFGEMGNELLLGNQNVQPNVLLQSGYDFIYKTIDKSLEHILNGKEIKSKEAVLN